MDPKLSLKQTQKLIMTPLLKQAIHILQLSTLELTAMLEQAVMENPLLEEGDSSEIEIESEIPTFQELIPGNGGLEKKEDNIETLEEVDWQNFFEDVYEPTPVEREEKQEISVENVVSSKTSLSEYLLWQLRLSKVDLHQYSIGEKIIGNIDEDGYLRASIDEIVAKGDFTREEVEEVLSIVQTFDPPGVGARDLKECILIQLNGQLEKDELAIEIVNDYFGELERKKHAEIAREMKVNLEEVMNSISNILKLEPKPGMRYFSGEIRYIEPDVFIIKDEMKYSIILNEENLPKLRISPFYLSIMNNVDNEDSKLFLEQKFRSALWLIRSIQQRQKTLFKVTESILKFQRDYFDNGIEYLKPLHLRDVAEDISVHESTVSRITTNKYVQTPQGLFELKYFFQSGISTDRGDSISSIKIKRIIENLIINEDSGHPLSDQEIVTILSSRGIPLARRTVAKYRNDLNILPSSHRRNSSRKK